MDYTVKLRMNFLLWYEDLQQLVPFPIEVPSQDPASLYPLVYQYENV